MIKWKVIAVAAMCAGGAMAASPAGAAPIGAAGLLDKATTADTGVTKVHRRRYRHCHRRWGRKRCHGRRHYRRGYGIDLPGVSLYFGKKRRHHHRHHRRRRWHD
jgi:hypothetical protein